MMKNRLAAMMGALGLIFLCGCGTQGSNVTEYSYNIPCYITDCKLDDDVISLEIEACAVEVSTGYYTGNVLSSYVDTYVDAQYYRSEYSESYEILRESCESFDDISQLLSEYDSDTIYLINIVNGKTKNVTLCELPEKVDVDDPDVEIVYRDDYTTDQHIYNIPLDGASDTAVWASHLYIDGGQGVYSSLNINLSSGVTAICEFASLYNEITMRQIDCDVTDNRKEILVTNGMSSRIVTYDDTQAMIISYPIYGELNIDGYGSIYAQLSTDSYYTSSLTYSYTESDSDGAIFYYDNPDLYNSSFVPNTDDGVMYGCDTVLFESYYITYYYADGQLTGGTPLIISSGVADVLNNNGMYQLTDTASVYYENGSGENYAYSLNKGDTIVPYAIDIDKGRVYIVSGEHDYYIRTEELSLNKELMEAGRNTIIYG